MRIAFGFPALSYGVIRNDTIIALSTFGFRNIETKEKVQSTDYFHIGSNTKSLPHFFQGDWLMKAK